jgi:type IV fimbrial biogenesis protein FimT
MHLSSCNHSVQLMRCAQKMRNGFSLIELMIVVSILGVTAALAAPSFASWVADTKTRSIAEAIQNGVRLAQGEAVKRSVRVQFVLTNNAPIASGVAASTTGKNWVIQTMQRANPGTVDEFLQGASLGTVSSTSLVSASAATVTFNSFGRIIVPTQDVTYTLTNPKGSRSLNVIVSRSGSVRMCDPAFNGTGNQLACTP